MSSSVFITLVALCLALGALLFWKSANRSFARRLVVALLPALIFVSVCGAMHRILMTPFFPWSDPRLAPLFGWKLGYPLYPGPGGVLTGRYGGPLCVMVYLPALWAPTPTVALLVGSVISMLFTFVPAGLIIFRNSVVHPSEAIFSAAIFLLFVLFAYASESLTYSMFTIHADAAALGFGAAACGVLLSYSERRRSVIFALAALLAALAVWSKQIQAPLMVALPLYTLLLQGPRQAGVFVLYLLGVGLLVSMVMVVCFGPFENLVLNMFITPARIRWNIATLTDAAAVVLDILSRASLPLLICIALAIHGVRRMGSPWSFKSFAAGNGWLLPALVALLNFPTSFMGYVKFGGNVNNLSFFIYFLALAAALGIKRVAHDLEAPRAGTRIQAALAVALLVSGAIQFFRSFRYLDTQPELRRNETQVAFDYAKAHPGTIFCPCYPLVGLLADGQYYHLDPELKNRALANEALTAAEFRKHIPASFKYLLFREAGHHATMDYLPEYSEPAFLPEFSEWQVLKRADKKEMR